MKAIVWNGPEQMDVEDLMRPGGWTVMVGLHGVVRGQICVRGSYAYTAEDYEQALEWLVEERAGIGELPPVLPLERRPDASGPLTRRPRPG